MNNRDENAFRVKPRAPRSGRGRDARFLDRVLMEVRRSRGVAGKPTRRTASRGRAILHRGRVAAAFAGDRLNARSRRVIVKTRLVLMRTGSRAVATHLRYLAREGVGREGLPGQAYDAHGDAADVKAFEERGRGDRHQFRFIISPEDAVLIEDLKEFTRELMERMEVDLATRLEWVAVDHWDTDNPHTHLVLRGTDQTGRDLVIDRTYLTRGMRLRAREIATEWLGPRTELEIWRSQQQDVSQERWTGLDRQLQARAQEGQIDLREAPADTARLRQRNLLIARLQRLESMELARKLEPGAGSYERTRKTSCVA